ncbi:hypothetical protein [Aeromonas sp. QDB02]|uniref:hypothetical protein n=1 Tax=Aeromonas sp. QDB02 TaxID=2990476 RepID=UPI0022E226FC|nr:hypothetical protein [Aeromonas sp. QDB02]
MENYRNIAESNNFIVLDKYIKQWLVAENYQSECDLERELIEEFGNQGYEFLPTLNNPEALQANVQGQLQTLNISEGLSREIELRQKQYEYYRDLLLSFPKQEEVAA